jgi:hypothetical protein
MAIVRKSYKDLIVLPIIGMTGLFLSAAYLAPLIYERQFIQIKAFVKDAGGFYFKDFFILNMADKLPQGNFWPFYFSMISFFVIFFCVLIMIFFIQVVKLSRNETNMDRNAVNIFFIGTATGSIVLLFSVSTFLWTTIPFFKYIQFPHRWLTITAFSVVFLSAALFKVLAESYKTKKGNILCIVLSFLVCILLGYSLILDRDYIKYAHSFESKIINPAKGAYPTVEHLPEGVTIDKIEKEEKLRGKVLVTKGSGKTEILLWESAERVIEVTAQKPVTIRIRTFNFPGWEAYRDGKLTTIKTEEGTGAMLIDIPEGKYILELKFEDTPIRYYSKIISIVSLTIIFFLAIFVKTIELKKQKHGKGN